MYTNMETKTAKTLNYSRKPKSRSKLKCKSTHKPNHKQIGNWLTKYRQLVDLAGKVVDDISPTSTLSISLLTIYRQPDPLREGVSLFK